MKEFSPWRVQLRRALLRQEESRGRPAQQLAVRVERLAQGTVAAVEEFEVPADVLDRRVDLVRDSRGEVADGLDPVRATQLLFELLLLRDVGAHAGYAVG